MNQETARAVYSKKRLAKHVVNVSYAKSNEAVIEAMMAIIEKQSGLEFSRTALFDYSMSELARNMGLEWQLLPHRRRNKK